MHHKRPRVLSIIPPMTQLNTPYPSTAYLTGFLRSRGVEAFQDDLAIGLALRLFSKEGLEELLSCAEKLPERERTVAIRSFLSRFARYRDAVGPAVSFLQGKDPTLAHRIAGRDFLPEGSRFEALEAFVEDESDDPLGWAFGSLGVQDRAKHMATLFLNDIADVIREAVDHRFDFVRYAESLTQCQPTFDPLAGALAGPPNLVDRFLRDLAIEAVSRHAPDLVLISVPFPGCVYGAFRIAQAVKGHDPKITTALGGGFVNTELRELKDPRLFDFFDFVTLDDGESPLWAILEYIEGVRPKERLVRTFLRDGGKASFIDCGDPPVPFVEAGTPIWEGLRLWSYLSLLDMLNPMHRLWSDGRWNKLAVARGCYWKKCSFCDTSLDYISRYEPLPAVVLVDQIEAAIAETGQTGFHFVDEAAPPKALKAMAAEVIKRGLAISWWGNIRFERAFTPELCSELAESGCIAVSGGIEVASDRVLKLINKGVTIADVARATHAFSESGIMVHAYLMYGFPTQTVQETVDALETVRQLFEAGCIQSGFFHRFACTVHSPVGKDPSRFDITLDPMPATSFAKNDIGFTDPTGVDHDALGAGLNRALYNYMHGIGLDQDVRSWFPFKVPRLKVPRNLVQMAISARR